MIFSNLKSFDDALPAGRLLGLDLGAKTVGLALSDHGRVVATPMETLRRTKFTKDTKQLRII
ncbi:MAG: Holliday junction resolvase RuvX, partial [Alphaproteobacteria bacterium]|nr:Holliday junction resolvase RuvX [Alphaproteobacteria bacterium]